MAPVKMRNACCIPTRAGCAVAALKCGLLPVNQISMEFYGRVAYHDYEGVALDMSEQQRLVQDLGDKPVLMLRNHGLLTVGETVGQAFLRMYYWKKPAKSTGRAGSGELVLPPAEVCAHTERQFNDPGRPLEEVNWRSGRDAVGLGGVVALAGQGGTGVSELSTRLET
jgi:hypothetical protein